MAFTVFCSLLTWTSAVALEISGLLWPPQPVGQTQGSTPEVHGGILFKHSSECIGTYFYWELQLPSRVPYFPWIFADLGRLSCCIWRSCFNFPPKWQPTVCPVHRQNQNTLWVLFFIAGSIATIPHTLFSCNFIIIFNLLEQNLNLGAVDIPGIFQFWYDHTPFSVEQDLTKMNKIHTVVASWWRQLRLVRNKDDIFHS